MRQRVEFGSSNSRRAASSFALTDGCTVWSPSLTSTTSQEAKRQVKEITEIVDMKRSSLSYLEKDDRDPKKESMKKGFGFAC
jgi:N-acetylglucosamine-6-phosphate deacetylase